MAPRLVVKLADIFPGSVHVRHLDMARAVDDAVWKYAIAHDLAIVSKDSDFHQRSFLTGPHPKVVRIRLGNRTTDDIEALLRREHAVVEALAADPQLAFIALG